MAEETFVSLKEPASAETVVKRSRFICQLIPVVSREEAEEALARVRKDHREATHNCFAMIIGPKREFEKASDDGEPQGTAGLPMLEALRKSGITNVLAVVTRYFGGTLLGAPGLVRAYSGSVAGTMKNARFVKNVPARVIRIRLPYADYSKLQSAASACDASVEAEFGADVDASVVVRADRADAFLKRMKEALLGALNAEDVGVRLLEEEVEEY